ncbi:MAG TPA: hypothetical protein DEG69_06170, partial [Flavobacteriaceae bacterium]|nr:hypothetical protein [Flavobacteriaceae bacterium]
ERPVINKVYDQGLEDTENTTLNFPIIVNNKRFYLERPSYISSSECTRAHSDNDYEDPPSEEDVTFAEWPDNIYSQSGGTFLVRANLELTAVAEGMISNNGDTTSSIEENESSKETLLEGSGKWRDMSIFSSFKNILYRSNSVIDIVSHTDKKVRIIIKLTKGKEYRYILNNTNLDLDSAKVFINGSEVSFNNKKLGYFICRDGEIEIEYTYDNLVPEDLIDFNATAGFYQKTDSRKALITEICSFIAVVESAYYVDQIKKSEGADNTIAADYMDYQIPNLNNYNADAEHVLFTPSSFCYTEKLDRLFSFDKKYEILRDSNSTNGLAYDGPLPATVKYIYPFVLDGGDVMSFSLTEEHAKGFINAFEPAKSDGSASFRNRPKSIRFDIEKLQNEPNDWQTVSSGETAEIDGRQNISITFKGALPSETYRLKLTNEAVQYYIEGEVGSYKNDLMRVPFGWSSLMRHSDIESISKDGVIKINLAEN